ncbi:MAG: PP2C family protein-serine/threonine phosphatase [Phycisphaerales bacterium]
MPITGALTAAISHDFRHEFERESLLHLRRRFLWYTGVAIGLNLLMGIAPLIVRLLSGSFFSRPRPFLNALASFTTVADLFILAGYILAYRYVRLRLLGRARLVKFMTALMIVAGLIRMVAGFLEYAVYRAGRPSVELALAEEGTLSLLGLVWTVLWTHVLACAFVPWTPREAMRPILTLSLGFAIVALAHLIRVGGAGWGAVVAAAVLFPLVGLPGAAVTLWNHGRFRESFLIRAIRGRYIEMKRELTDARRIHEALFPAPAERGSLRFDYRYEPMRQIGGDFLYTRFSPGAEGTDPSLNLLLLDVTGHGIPAALTVNRLYGEVERLFAEDPAITPDRVLRALNRYVYLTLADHSLFVTALAVRIDPGEEAGQLKYASAGHPPAFIRAVDGTLEQLDSTAPVLGAFVDSDYDVELTTRPFTAGDAFLGYTDGAMETRDGHGRMLGVDGLLRALGGRSRGAPLPPGAWTQAILDAVNTHRLGPPTDDTLIVEVTRAFVSAPVEQRGQPDRHAPHRA